MASLKEKKTFNLPLGSGRIIQMEQGLYIVVTNTAISPDHGDLRSVMPI